MSGGEELVVRQSDRERRRSVGGEGSAVYGDELPVRPLPRQVYLFRHPRVNLEAMPFFLDYPQDIYFRHYAWNRQPVTLVSWSDPARRREWTLPATERPITSSM